MTKLFDLKRISLSLEKNSRKRNKTGKGKKERNHFENLNLKTQDWVLVRASPGKCLGRDRDRFEERFVSMAAVC